MPIGSANAWSLARSLGVYLALGDVRLNGFAAIHPTTETAINGLTVVASAVVTRLDAGRPVVPDVFSVTRYQEALRVVQYVNGAGANVAAARDRVEQAEFAMASLGLPWAAVTANNAPSLAAVRAAWGGLSPVEGQVIGSFARSRAANAAIAEVSAVANAPGGTVAQNLATLAAVAVAADGARPGDAQRYSAIRSTTIGDLRSLMAASPPDTAFAGFAAWGPGDHATVASNIRWHFLKHVLGITQEPAELDGAEHADWWRRLRIELTWAQFQQFRGGYPDTDHLQWMFYGPNASLADAYVTEFLAQARLAANHPRVIGHLVGTYEPAYRQHAITMSTQLDEVLVQSNGIKTFVSGCKADLFVIGRLANGVLGISSAYFARNIDEKMRGARANKIWNLT